MKIGLALLEQIRGGDNSNGNTVESFDALVAQLLAAYHIEHTVDDGHATITATGPISERDRNTPIGVWIDVPFLAGTYTASTGTWTVVSGSQITLKYMLVGTTMHVAWYIEASALSAACSTIYMTIPASSVVEGNYFIPFSYDDNGTRGTGLARVRQASTVIGGTKLELWKDLRGASMWSASNALAVCGQMAFEVASADSAPALASAVTFTFTGGSTTATPGALTYFTTPGTYTMTVTGPWTFLVRAIAAGGAGRPTAGPSGNGGGGGGSGSYTTGTNVTLVPGKTYTLVIPPAVTSGTSGAALTLVNTTDTVTLVSLGGGLSGGQSVTGAAGGTASVGTGLVNGSAGGNGSTEAVGGSTAGTSDTSGAGGGGGGTSGDGLGANQNGGAGKDEAGQAPASDGTGNNRGGRGGGYDFNGTKCGYGGGGAEGITVGATTGGASGQGGAVFVG